jgi:hypothetical protein
MQWQRNPTVRLLPGSRVVVGTANYRRGDGSARDVFPLHKQRKGSLYELQRHGSCAMVTKGQLMLWFSSARSDCSARGHVRMEVRVSVGRGRFGLRLQT